MCLSFLANADLMHDTVLGRSTSGILEFINQMPIDWFSKQQGQVETETDGSKLMVAQQAGECMIDLCSTFCCFGVPLNGPLWIFGNNESIVMSSAILHSTLGKPWNALSHHCMVAF